MSAETTIVSFGGDETELAPPSSLTFGRIPTGEPPSRRHLGLSDSTKIHLHAGTIEVDDRGDCTVRNTGRWLHIRVVGPGGNLAELAPGRSMRVPWPTSTIELTTGDEEIRIALVCPVADDSPAPVAATASGDTTMALPLDRSSGYFRAVVALCAPRLRDPASREVATVGEIASRLSRLDVESGPVSIKAVERRLAHARQRLGLTPDAEGGSAAGLEVRHAGEQLVDLLLRTGTVTRADLALIDGRPTR